MELNHIKENIDLFVKGKLNGANLADLENLISSDPKVASEVKLQEMITRSIQADRKAALKARLSNIQVPTVYVNPGQTVARFTAMRAASVVVASVGLGLGAYLYFRSDSGNTIETDVVQVAPKIEDSIEIDASSTGQNNGAISEKVVTEQIGKGQEIVPNEGKTVNVEASGNNIEKVTAKKNRTEPNHRDFLDNNKFESENEAAVKTDTKEAKEIVASEDATKASDVDIKNIQDGEHGFHYMMKESVLYLYGNFDASPYEILEFNDKDGQALYLYYDSSFFALKSSQTEIRKLKKIADKKLVEELSEARVKRH